MNHKPILVVLSLLAFTSCDRLDVASMFFSSGTHTEDRVAECAVGTTAIPAIRN